MVVGGWIYMNSNDRNQFVFPRSSRKTLYRRDWTIRQINRKMLKPVYVHKDLKKAQKMIDDTNGKIKEWALKLQSDDYVLNRPTDKQGKSDYSFYSPNSIHKSKQYLVGADPGYSMISKKNKWIDVDNNTITRIKYQRIHPIMQPTVNGIIYFPDHSLLEKLVLVNLCVKWDWQLCWTFKFKVSPKFIFGIKKGKKVGFFRTDKSKISVVNNIYYQNEFSSKPHPRDKDAFKSLEEDILLTDLIINSPTPVGTVYGCQLFARYFRRYAHTGIKKIGQQRWEAVNLDDIDISKEFRIAEQVAHFLKQHEYRD